MSLLSLTNNFQWTKAYYIQKVTYDEQYPCWREVWSQLLRENNTWMLWKSIKDFTLDGLILKGSWALEVSDRQKQRIVDQKEC